MRKERLELSRVAPLAPKASASTNSATFAYESVSRFNRQVYRYLDTVQQLSTSDFVATARDSADCGGNFSGKSGSYDELILHREAGNRGKMVGREGLEPSTK